MGKSGITAVVSWPNAPFTESLVRRAIISSFKHPLVVASTTPGAFTHLLQWSSYDDIDHQLAHSNRSTVLSSSYTIRKSLIRKHFLNRSFHSYVTKYKESILAGAVPRTWELELSFSDELDEMFCDELWELGAELENPEKWWILKPGMADRGMGIRLFNSKSSLQAIFEEFEEDSGGEQEDGGTAVLTSQLRHFVIQEYISTPLLFDPSQVFSEGTSAAGQLKGHKFHLRVYCVASGALTVYLYPRILALFSSVPYTPPIVNTNGPSSFDMEPHLTNSSLQIQSGDRGVRLLDELIGCDILSSNSPRDNAKLTGLDVEAIIDQIADILSDTFKAAAANPIHFQVTPNAFELFGVDFLVSHSETAEPLSQSLYQVKILEVNAEPAIELTGPRVSWILDDLFTAVSKVCIEPFFHKQDNQKSLGDEVWLTGETRYGLRKCLEMNVRGFGSP